MKLLKEPLINGFCERIAAFSGARNFVYRKICLNYCAPCALLLISQKPFISGSLNASGAFTFKIEGLRDHPRNWMT